MEFIQVPYPPLTPRIRNANGSNEVFCIVRKKWLKASPEEWVRQNFLIYLNDTLGYPLSIMAVEKTIQVGELKKRFDILVYNHNHQPKIIIECKAPAIKLDNFVMTQALNYYSVIQSEFVVICNGPLALYFLRKENELILIDQLPAYIQNR
jgi:hypothetical protein